MSDMRSWRDPLITTILASVVFVFSWFLRYNDPEGGFAGLLDDHYFYLARAFQILHGELPDRDFVDIGAPLTFAVSAAMQHVFGPGIWAEVILSVTMLAAAAALTYVAAKIATGSHLLGLFGAAFQIFLLPRFYNYPKLLAYAVAVPLTWYVVNRPTATRLVWIALVTVIAFLLRHDHGVFVAALFVATTLWSYRVSPATLRAVALYSAFVLLFLAPYLAYLHWQRGIVEHFAMANDWSMWDRARAPLVLPRFHIPENGQSLQALAGANLTASLFYVLVAIPVLSLGLVWRSRDAWRPTWSNARAKIGGVAVLGILLNAGFLRGALAARLADVAVPQAILAAWLLLVAGKTLLNGSARRRAGVGLALLLLLVAIGIPLGRAALTQVDMSEISPHPEVVAARADEITGRLSRTWPLDTWSSPDAQGVMRLIFYLEACTAPTDRVMVSPYLPQVPVLARRAFAGGLPDLRPGVFDGEREQELYIQRFKRASVPVLVLPVGEDLSRLEEGLPVIFRYFREHYEYAGDRDLGDGRELGFMVRRDRVPSGRYELLDLPCYR